MIDFIRIHFREKNAFEYDIKNDKDNFPGLNLVLEDRTGQIKYPHRTKMNNLDIVISEKSAHIKGSLHYLNNNLNRLGNHNFNDFALSQLTNCVEELINKIPSIKYGALTLLEFGFNIVLPFQPKTFINNNLLNYRDKMYNVKRKYPKGGIYSVFDTHDYKFKIYDKGQQFKRDKKILRMELKFRKSKIIQSFGIYNITDLTDKSKLMKIFNFFMKRFDELTIIDDFEHVKSISLEDYSAIEKYTNPNFWLKYSSRKKRSTKYRYKKKFKHLISKYKLDKNKRIIKSLLKEKFNYLLNS